MSHPAVDGAALELARTLIRERIAPRAAEIDEAEEFPVDTIKQLGQSGLLGMPYPEQYGGSNLNYLTYVSIVREIAQVCASTAMTILAHSTLASYPIYRYGTETQKQKYLKALAEGSALGAFAVTEPAAGSDIGGMQLQAVKEGPVYRLNGTKIFITNANYANLFVVAANTDHKKGVLGIKVFVVERDTPGFRPSGKRERKLGMRGSDTGELVFEDALVPADNVIGRKQAGLKILHETLVTARIGMAAIAVGIAEGARNQCLGYVRQREQFGKKLSEFQSIKNMVSDMEVGISAARLLLERAAQMKDEGTDVTKVASEAKLFASEMSTKITKDAIQIFGGYGYSRDLPLERFFRDAKLTEIGDGTSEIQRLIIADEAIRRNR